MKKTLIALSLILSISSIYAAEKPNEDREEKSAASSTLSSSSNTQQFESLDQLMQRFSSDPTNYEKKGGFGGWWAEDAPKQESIKAFLGMLVQYNQDLRQQLQISNGAVQNADAVKRALDETQKKLDAETDARKQKEAELVAEQERNKLLEHKRQELLSGLSNSKLLIEVEKQRKEEAEIKARFLKDTLAQISAKVSQIEELEKETLELEESKLLPQEGSAQEIGIRLGRITLIIKQKREKLEDLKKEKEALELRQAETAKQIEELQQRINENDYYQQIADMIPNRAVMEADVKFHIVCICTFLQTDLDKLSEGRPSLIGLALDYTLPRTPRPEMFPPVHLEEGQVILQNVERRFRDFGNDFGQVLGWVGPPMDKSKLKHRGSPFEAQQKQVEAQAKDYMQSLSSGSKGATLCEKCNTAIKYL
jgi:hypothetical protein